MSDDQTATLNKKIESACFDISIYPKLDDFATSIGKASVSSLVKISGAPLQFEKINASVKKSSQSLSDADNNKLIYHSICSVSGQNIFLSASPEFAASLSECVLGGEFALSTASGEATSIDAEILCFAIDHLMNSVDKYFEANLAGSGNGAQLSQVKLIEASDSLLKSLQDVPYCNLSLDIMDADGHSAPAAVTFHLPVDYLDAYGFLVKGRRQNSGPDENSRWRLDMEDNVHNSEIELNFILDSYKAPLSDLAKLEVDQLIKLSDNPDRSMRILIDTSGGPQEIGIGKLGACGELKAAKIVSMHDL